MPKKERRLILHVGLPKTGTTALQFWCENNRANLLEHDILYPKASENEFAPKHQFIVDELKSGSFTRTSQALAEGKQSTILLSAEGLSNNLYQFSEEALAGFRELTKDYRLQIVLVLRDPEPWINSMWKEGVLAHPGYAGSLEDYAKEERVCQLLDYDTLAADLKSFFCADQIDLIRLEDDWKSGLMSVLGIEELQNEIHPNQQNVSLSKNLTHLVRQINALRLGPKFRRLLLSVLQAEIKSKHNLLVELEKTPHPGILQSLELRKIFSELKAENKEQEKIIDALVRHSQSLLIEAKLRSVNKSSSGVQQVRELAERNGKRRYYPKSDDYRLRNKILCPDIQPKFTVDFHSEGPIFSFGCAFARDLEKFLSEQGFSVPLMEVKLPKREYSPSHRGFLNDENPAVVLQKVVSALEGKAWPEGTLVASQDGVLDLCLSDQNMPLVSMERAKERRHEIECGLTGISNAGVVFLCLSGTEAWFDKLLGVYVNALPHFLSEAQDMDRYVLQRLDVFDIQPVLEEMVERLEEKGIKVILMVSPIPIAQTYSASDAILADSLSKAILRVCAERVAKKYSHVDYFPAWEMIASKGRAAFTADGLRIAPKIVKETVSYLLDCYSPSSGNPPHLKLTQP